MVSLPAEQVLSVEFQAQELPGTTRARQATEDSAITSVHAVAADTQLKQSVAARTRILNVHRGGGRSYIIW